MRSSQAHFSSTMKTLRHQKFASIPLKPKYLPENLSVKVLELKDKQGNRLALYESDYLKFKDYLKRNNIELSKLTPLQKAFHLEKANVKLIKYLSAEKLPGFEIDYKKSDFSSKGDIVTIDGTKLKKEKHQNCLCLYQNKLFAYPKLRPQPGNIENEIDSIDNEGSTEEKKSESTLTKKGIIGINHSSFCSGNRVPFAGSFIHDEKIGWIIENSTGHFGTYAYQMRTTLEKLAKEGVDLSLFTVRTWVSKKRDPSPEEKDWIIRYENAAIFLARIHKSQKSLGKENKEPNTTIRQDSASKQTAECKLSESGKGMFAQAVDVSDIAALSDNHSEPTFSNNTLKSGQ